MTSNQGLLLLKQIESENLLKRLIDQINKDADLAGLDLFIKDDISVEELVKSLYSYIYRLITSNNESYLSFLYRVDIDENTIKNTHDKTVEQIAENSTYLILKREWQKIYFRSKNL